MDVIDLPGQEPEERVYLNKSARLYKVYGALFLFSIAMSILMKQVDKHYSDVADWLTVVMGLAILTIFALSPLGLFYCWKSYAKKEGTGLTRAKHAFGHIFISFLLVIVVGLVVADVSALLD